ncbi:hypothetical protein XELAEV_18007269mg [Xenopus laevis]|uniref:Uncharacterized protein n=1 Tax=Xenopus laevis TaxID=8355 RepID=A0A974I4C0_XENLA|nr:hypothetical protein XELAEV_18007269mg [Xenopus laevis]
MNFRQMCRCTSAGVGRWYRGARRRVVVGKQESRPGVSKRIGTCFVPPIHCTLGTCLVCLPLVLAQILIND